MLTTQAEWDKGCMTPPARRVSPCSVGAELERERLGHRARRIEVVIAALRQLMNARAAEGPVPAALGQSIAAFARERTEIDRRLAGLDGGAGVDRSRLLRLLGNRDHPLTIGELRELGVERPGEAIYELELEGYPVERVRRHRSSGAGRSVSYRLEAPRAASTGDHGAGATEEDR